MNRWGVTCITKITKNTLAKIWDFVVDLDQLISHWLNVAVTGFLQKMPIAAKCQVLGHSMPFMTQQHLC